MRLWSACLVLVAVTVASPIKADLMSYSTRSDFDAATINYSVIDFSNLAPPNSFAFFGIPGFLSLSGVTFETPNGPLFVQNDGAVSRLSYQQGVPSDVLDVTLPAGITALGFNYVGTLGQSITFSSGDSFNLPPAFLPVTSFVGFTFDQPVSSFQLTGIGGGDVAFFSFGVAVPEPSSLCLVVFALAANIRRGRNIHTIGRRMQNPRHGLKEG